MDLRTRAAQKRPLTHSAEWESDESEGNSSDAPPADVWAPSPVVSELNTTHIPLEPVSCSDPPESTSSTSEGGSSVRVLALAPKKVEFPSWEVFEDYLAVYQAQTFQARVFYSCVYTFWLTCTMNLSVDFQGEDKYDCGRAQRTDRPHKVKGGKTS